MSVHSLQFFSPIEPLHIDIELTRQGKAAGDAIVEFETESDAKDALKRHREMIGQLIIACAVTILWFIKNRTPVICLNNFNTY